MSGKTSEELKETKGERAGNSQGKKRKSGHERRAPAKSSDSTASPTTLLETWVIAFPEKQPQIEFKLQVPDFTLTRDKKKNGTTRRGLMLHRG